ncbi:MAG TPA: YhbY family RNA-binding protein [Candidatus Nanoarchaeia archaeon]|nr:YhbY family RNA-binding protein [Candidatus Nanoarchaeia archaeon]
MSILIMRKRASQLEPSVWIGKNGLTGAVLNEIKVALEKKECIKVKILKGALEHSKRQEIAHSIVEQSGSQLVQLVGNVIVLYKKGLNKPKTR